jgi:hypothetical protein
MMLTADVHLRMSGTYLHLPIHHYGVLPKHKDVTFWGRGK